MLGATGLSPPPHPERSLSESELARYAKLEFGDDGPSWLHAEISRANHGRRSGASKRRGPWTSSVRNVAKSIAAFLL